MVRTRLFRLYWALERWIVPDMGCSQTEYSRIVKSLVTNNTRWLDIGCGHQLWAEWVPGQKETARSAALLVGLDPDVASLSENALVHYRVAGLQLPFKDGAFDLVTANMVFEHLDDPLDVLIEIRRVLAPGGACVFHTPNSRYWMVAVGRHFPQPVKNAMIRLTQGRAEKDVYPTHYRINTEDVIRELSRRGGFTDEEIVLMNSTAAARLLLLGPGVIGELLWNRLTQSPGWRQHRSNIIGVMRVAG